MREQIDSDEQAYNSYSCSSFQREGYTKKLNAELYRTYQDILKEIQIAQHVNSVQQNKTTKKDLQNVISVWRTSKEAGNTNGQIVMERGEIDGRSYLTEIIINSKDGAEKCVKIGKVIIEHVRMGLKGLAKHGVKFSDLKLKNIVETKDGTWKIIDFGKAELHQNIEDNQLQEEIKRHHRNQMVALGDQIAHLIQILSQMVALGDQIPQLIQIHGGEHTEIILNNLVFQQKQKEASSQQFSIMDYYSYSCLTQQSLDKSDQFIKEITFGSKCEKINAVIKFVAMNQLKIVQHIMKCQSSNKKDFVNIITYHSNKLKQQSRKVRIVMDKGQFVGQQFFKKIEFEFVFQSTKSMLIDLLNGLNTLAKYNITYFDLKLDNIVRMSDKKWKIIDFGYAIIDFSPQNFFKQQEKEISCVNEDIGSKHFKKIIRSIITKVQLKRKWVQQSTQTIFEKITNSSSCKSIEYHLLQLEGIIFQTALVLNNAGMGKKKTIEFVHYCRKVITKDDHDKKSQEEDFYHTKIKTLSSVKQDSFQRAKIGERQNQCLIQQKNEDKSSYLNNQRLILKKKYQDENIKQQLQSENEQDRSLPKEHHVYKNKKQKKCILHKNNKCIYFSNDEIRKYNQEIFLCQLCVREQSFKKLGLYCSQHMEEVQFMLKDNQSQPTSVEQTFLCQQCVKLLIQQERMEEVQKMKRICRHKQEVNYLCLSTDCKKDKKILCYICKYQDHHDHLDQIQCIEQVQKNKKLFGQRMQNKFLKVEDPHQDLSDIKNKAHELDFYLKGLEKIIHKYRRQYERVEQLLFCLDRKRKSNKEENDQEKQKKQTQLKYYRQDQLYSHVEDYNILAIASKYNLEEWNMILSSIKDQTDKIGLKAYEGVAAILEETSKQMKQAVFGQDLIEEAEQYKFCQRPKRHPSPQPSPEESNLKKEEVQDKAIRIDLDGNIKNKKSSAITKIQYRGCQDKINEQKSNENINQMKQSEYLQIQINEQNTYELFDDFVKDMNQSRCQNKVVRLSIQRAKLNKQQIRGLKTLFNRCYQLQQIQIYLLQSDYLECQDSFLQDIPKTIKKINFVNRNGEYLKLEGAFLKELPNIEQLYFAYFQQDEFTVINSLPSKIRSLTLDNVQMGEMGLHFNNVPLPQLQHLKLSHTKGEGIQNWLLSLNIPKLTYLILQGIDWVDMCLLNILTNKLQSIKHLTINKCDNITNVDFARNLINLEQLSIGWQLGSQIKLSHKILYRLKSLQICQSQLKKQFINNKSPSKPLRKLTTLILYNVSGVNVDNCWLFNKAKLPNITKLNIKSNDWVNNDILNKIGKKLPSIQQLNIGECNVDSLYYLSYYFPKMRNLQVFSQYQKTGGEYIPGLKYNKQLKKDQIKFVKQKGIEVNYQGKKEEEKAEEQKWQKVQRRKKMMRQIIENRYEIFTQISSLLTDDQQIFNMF